MVPAPIFFSTSPIEGKFSYMSEQSLESADLVPWRDLFDTDISEPSGSTESSYVETYSYEETDIEDDASSHYAKGDGKTVEAEEKVTTVKSPPNEIPKLMEPKFGNSPGRIEK